MSEQTPESRQDQVDEFERQADMASPGLIGETIDFLRYNKKWWLLPLLIVLAVVGVFAVIGGGPLAPFIYTLF